MAWSEVLSRITIHLNLTSASLVVLALVVQVSGFGTAFTAMFVTMVNAPVAGTLGGLVAYALDGGSVVIAVTGVLAGLTYLGVQLEYGRRTYDADRLNRGSRCPTPGA